MYVHQAFMARHEIGIGLSWCLEDLNERKPDLKFHKVQIKPHVQRTFCGNAGLACDLDVVQHVLTVFIQQHIHLALRLRRLYQLKLSVWM